MKFKKSTNHPQQLSLSFIIVDAVFLVSCKMKTKSHLFPERNFQEIILRKMLTHGIRNRSIHTLSQDGVFSLNTKLIQSANIIFLN